MSVDAEGIGEDEELLERARADRIELQAAIAERLQELLLGVVEGGEEEGGTGNEEEDAGQGGVDGDEQQEEDEDEEADEILDGVRGEHLQHLEDEVNRHGRSQPSPRRC